MARITLYVRLSVFRWYSVKTAKHIIEFLLPPRIPLIVVFSKLIDVTKLQQGHSERGC